MNAQTNLGGQFFISTSFQNFDLDESGFVSLEYQLVPGMGNHGDTGVDQPSRSYAVFGSDHRIKVKEIASAPDVTVEFIQGVSAGMTLLNLAAEASNNSAVAFMILWPNGTAEYNRGIVSGPRLLKGGNEDFKLIEFTLGLLQAPVIVDYEPLPDNDPYFVQAFLAPT